MKDNWNLSDWEIITTQGKPAYLTPYVKEFIRQLEEEMISWRVDLEKKKPYRKLTLKDVGWNNAINNILELIDSKAGSKLTENKEKK